MVRRSRHCISRSPAPECPVALSGGSCSGRTGCVCIAVLVERKWRVVMVMDMDMDIDVHHPLATATAPATSACHFTHVYFGNLPEWWSGGVGEEAFHFR